MFLGNTPLVECSHSLDGVALLNRGKTFIRYKPIIVSSRVLPHFQGVKDLQSQYKQSYLKLILREAHANGFRNCSYETHKSADLLNNDLCDIILALKDIKSVVLSPSNFPNPMPWAEWKNSPWKVQSCPHYRKFWLPRRIQEMPTIDLTWLGKGMLMLSPCYNSQWYQATIHYPKLAEIRKHYQIVLMQLTFWTRNGKSDFVVSHMEAETKWTPFRRRHFQVHFLEWKCKNFA